MRPCNKILYCAIFFCLSFSVSYFLLNVVADMASERQNMADGSDLLIKNGSSFIVSLTAVVYLFVK